MWGYQKIEMDRLYLIWLVQSPGAGGKCMKPTRNIRVLIICMTLILFIGISQAASNNVREIHYSDNQTEMNGQTIQVMPAHAPDRLIVQYRTDKVKPGPGLNATMEKMNREMGTTVVKDFSPGGMPGMQLVRPDNGSLEDTLQKYANDSNILYVEEDHVIALSPSETPETINTTIKSSTIAAITTPNDPDYSLLWGLHNTGQAPFYGTSGADINALGAWSKTTGSSTIVVAVVDTGVEYTHPDLKANIWTNTKEISGNKKDDDGNGYIDDVRGWNFVSKSNEPLDDNGHGTHCAGTIAAVGNNKIGITGVCWTVKIMPLKFLDSSGIGYTSDAISAILYANKMKARVISNSWAGIGYSQALKDAIDASSAVVVCAAGNDGVNTDSSPVYPADYTSKNIISVAATDYHDKLASFSNYGSTSVDIAAPGVKIRSTYKGSTYAYLSGTSMATPHVSGVAALTLATSPTLTNTQVIAKILSGSKKITALKGKMLSGGRLNAAGTITASSSSTQTVNTSNTSGHSDFQVSFTAAPLQGNAPVTVQFLDTSSGGMDSWQWNFGDGGVANGKNPRHTYQNTGEYTVTLTISNRTSSKTIQKEDYISVK